MSDHSSDVQNSSPDYEATPAPIVPKANIIPFILLVSCFALWGLLNNMTDNLVPAFGKIFSLPNSHSTLVQVAFYGAYAVLAFPAALIIKKFSYKTGVLVGLGLYILGALGYVPAAYLMEYKLFLVSIFVLAGGLSILETSCNPYVIAMGPESTAVRRLNFAQMFNPMGSLTGLFIGKYIILRQLHPSSAAERQEMAPEILGNIQTNELFWLSLPYIFLVLIAGAIFMTIFLRRMPEGADHEHSPHVRESLKRLLSLPRYYWGVIAQFFYVGVQITVWTFTIKYIMAVLPGMKEDQAAIYGIYAIALFIIARVVCTWLMKIFNPGNMMALLAVLGILFSFSTVYAPGMIGVWSLVAISGCMSLMFPTIYGIALRNLGPEVKIGASGLIMAILGGAVITQIHAWLIDKLLLRQMEGALISWADGQAPSYENLHDPVFIADHFPEFNEIAVRTSFYIPVVCFAVVLVYALAFRNAHLSKPLNPS